MGSRSPVPDSGGLCRGTLEALLATVSARSPPDHRGRKGLWPATRLAGQVAWLGPVVPRPGELRVRCRCW